ncbi:MAG TPA: acetyltransferase [Acidimicrobiia bacterium]|nr:acetyltransferase [Acidimicrobiia bacterium]
MTARGPSGGAVPVVLIGTGGHAHVCVELLAENPSIEVVGCTGPTAPGEGEMPVPYLGPDESLADLHRSGIDHAFVAVGDNARRAALFQDLETIGLAVVSAVSRAAVISPSARLGTGVAVMAGAVVNAGARIGDGAIVNTGASVDHDTTIGAFAHIAPRVAVAGWSSVGTGAFLGVGCAVIDKVSIGEWTVVGAGAAVVDDLPDRVTAVGVPARPLVRCEGSVR